MKSLAIAFAASLALIGSALAQQRIEGPQIPTAAQRCGSVLGQVAAENATLGEKYDELRAQLSKQAEELTQAQDQVKQLQDKYEPKKPAPGQKP